MKKSSTMPVSIIDHELPELKDGIAVNCYKCQNCDILFLRLPSHGPKPRLCSMDCVKQSKTISSPAYIEPKSKPKLLTKRQCIECLSEYQPKSARQKRCQPCIITKQEAYFT